MTLQATFATLRSRRELALMPYFVAGYPTLEQSLALIDRAAASGADILEIGVPFSDPVADGVTIQTATQEALAAGFRLPILLDRLRERTLACPIVLMSYLNPLLAYGRERLLADLQRAGFSGLIVPDLPVEESGDWRIAAAAREIDLVCLTAPTSTDERLRTIAGASAGFIYAVSLTGTTGARAGLDPGIADYLKRLRRATDKPIAVGFGISKPEHVRALRGQADGVVVGSRLVEAIRANEDPVEVIQNLKRATRG